MMVTGGEIDVTGVDALSVAKKVTALPVATVGAVGVPVSWLPTIWSPAGRVPAFREKVIAPVPPVTAREIGVMAVPTV